MDDLPAKVVRGGGTVMEFDQPRHAYKSVAGDRVCTLIVPADTPVVYPQSSGSWNNEHLRVAEAIVDDISAPLRGRESADSSGDEPDGEWHETRAENAMESGFWYVEGERVEPDEFSDDVAKVSAPGIHVFATEVGARHW
jgi:hypothetical protein